MKLDVTQGQSCKSIFVTATGISDVSARQAYLDAVCGEDSALRIKVDGLLAASATESSNLLDGVVEQLGHGAQGASIDISSHPMIGPYKLLERLGEGGMGAVYMAQQKSPVKRKVALKLIKPGMDSKEVIARFEAERQALAMMNHSNIARIFDGGLTEQGRPYFVMELVRGLPIDAHCDEATLSVRDRLKLFINVCRAVHHAHQKGIIHRDLKPSNVLVTLHDGVPVVKVIDFGIAKALEHDLTERTLFTRLSELIGTPDYMSPEQAEMSGLDVDTRSDIYSLGVMLYKLLAGVTPFEEDSLKTAGLDEMRRIIREDEPLRPSRRVSTFNEDVGSTISERRRTSPRELSLSMQRELDWIVMKALEKDRNRRYESASALSQDVQRYLDHETVEACPPSMAYRLRVFVRRNRVVLVTAALIMISLLVGTGVSLWHAREADRARQLAEDKSFQLEDQRDLAQANEAFGRHLVYAADVRLAAQAWESGDIRHYADLLDRHSPSPGSDDLRGFEWRYLRQLGTTDVQTIAAGTQGVCSVRHSPDGRYLAAGRDDGTVDVFDAPSRQKLKTLSGHVGLIRGFDFSPDSQQLASIGYGGVILIHDLTTFRELRRIRAFENLHGYGVCFAMNGQSVVAIAEQSPAKLWDADSGELLDAFGDIGRGCWGLAVSPDGQSCVLRDNSNNEFRVWDLNPRKHVAWLRFPLPGESACCLRYSTDGRFIAAGTDKKMVRVYESRTGTLINSFPGHDDQIWDVAFHSNGTMLASCDGGGVIRMWSLDSNSDASKRNDVKDWPHCFRGHTERVWSLDFSPDGKHIVTASKDGRVLAWAGRAHPRQELNVTDSIASKFTSSGDELVIAGQNMLAIRNSRTNKIRPFGEGFHEDSTCLAVSPDDAMIASGHIDGSVRIWNRQTGQIHSLLRAHDGSVEQIAFSPDNTLMLTAGWDGAAVVWDVASGNKRHVIDLPPHCMSADFSPDGRMFALSSENDAMLYDAATARRIHLLQGHQHSARCVAFSPDGRWLATGSDDRTVRIWDTSTGRTRHVIPAHREQICTLAVSPDGRTIATGDESGTVAFSHVETGRFLFDAQLADDKVSSLSFLPDGQTLAVTCHAKLVILLHAPVHGTFVQDSTGRDADDSD